MKELLLKRALPFALTFAVGAAVGGFFQLFGGGRGWAGPRHNYRFENRRGCGKKFRRNYLAPETKAPVILFKPDARAPRWFHGNELPRPARVRVTFGEDGKVRDVVAGGQGSIGRYWPELSEAAERAARQIQFIPATADGAPTTVTEEVEIRFSFQ
jgi:hypothetical protein